MTHVPYRGGAPLSLAVVAGEVDMGLSDLPVFTGPARDGLMRILAVGSPQRLAMLPDVPTLNEEQGVRGVVTEQLARRGHRRRGAAGRAGPACNAAAAGALRDPEVARAITGQGMEPVGNSRAGVRRADPRGGAALGRGSPPRRRAAGIGEWRR